MQGRKGNIEVSKEIGRLLLSACAYTSAAPAFPSVAATVPATAAATGTASIDVGKRSVLDVVFAGTDAADETFGYIAIGWMPVQGGVGQGWFPVQLAAGVVTLGSTTLGTAGAFLEASGSLVADTITETTACPFSQVYSPADNTAAHLVLDVSQFHAVTILVSLNGKTAATMDVIATLGDSAGGVVRFDPDITGYQKHTVRVTTAVATGTGYIGPVTGRLLSIRYTKTDYAAGVDFAITNETTGEAIWTGTNVNATVVVRPRASVHNFAGAVMYYSTGATISSEISECFVLVNERIKIVVTEGGDGKVGDFTVVTG